MDFDPARRSLLLAGACAAVLAPGRRALAEGAYAANAADRLQALEDRHGGRLGVSILDTASSERIGHRADERFPMCSTFKFLARSRAGRGRFRYRHEQVAVMVL